uniref:Protein tincar n=1 Tax=Caenorhabditis tropicalis TaxID=1561998 RepID=A0A1I7TW84_9PELO
MQLEMQLTQLSPRHNLIKFQPPPPIVKAGRQDHTMTCNVRPKLNNLSSIWYTILTTLLQVYLLYLGFERYRLYNEIKWPTGGYPYGYLMAYAIIYFSSIIATFLFFASGVFKSGNIAGDNERLADRENRVIEVSRNSNGGKSGCVHGLKVLWQHLPPLPQQLHVIIAISQLIAQQLMFSQLFRHGFVNSGDFLNTELDFLYQRSRQLATNLPIGETRLQGFRITADELAGLPVSPNLLPVLMHMKLFGIPLEFVNLFVALVAFGITYPSVFWRVSKHFSIIFSLHLVIYAAQVIWGYISFSILFRIQETNIHSARPVGLGQYLGPIKPLGFHIYHPYIILGSFVVRLVMTTLAPMAMYSYGYNKYHANVLSLQHKLSSRTSHGQAEYGDYRRRSYNRSDSKLCCDGYLPHMDAIALLVIVAAAIGPTIYALLILYQHEQKPLILTCIIIDVVYMFSWILMWLGMTLKRDWEFNIIHKVHHIYGLNKGLAIGQIDGNENPSDLKNSILIVHKDAMYVTDYQNAKQSLLRAIHTGKFEQISPPEEVYWKQGQQSPAVSAKILTDPDGVKNSPEMSRLLRMGTDDTQQTMSYHSNGGRNITQAQMTNSQIMQRGNSSPPGPSQFGTIQRNQQQYGQMGTLQRGQSGGTLQRGAMVHDNVWNQYSAIQKKEEQHILGQRRDSGENAYGRVDSTYGSYARIPNVSRIQVTPQGSQIRVNGYGGLQQNTLTRRDVTPPQHSQQPSLSSIRQSPLLSDRSGINVPPPQPLVSREQSPYQRSAIKLSSFSDNKGSGIYGTSGIGSGNTVQWGGTQRTTPGQPSQLLWNTPNTNGHNKSSLTSTTTSSQNDEQCFTPTSTLTSHGSNYTPTPGSPQGSNAIYSRINGASSTSSNLYGVAAAKESQYADRTLQKAPIKSTTVTTGNTILRAVNGTDDTVSSFARPPTGALNQNDYATSIV